MWADDPGQRVRDEVRWTFTPAARRAASRVPPQVFRVQQVRSPSGARGPLLHARREFGLRTGLAQIAQELCYAYGAQGQSRKAAS